MVVSPKCSLKAKTLPSPCPGCSIDEKAAAAPNPLDFGGPIEARNTKTQHQDGRTFKAWATACSSSSPCRRPTVSPESFTCTSACDRPPPRSNERQGSSSENCETSGSERRHQTKQQGP